MNNKQETFDNIEINPLKPQKALKLENIPSPQTNKTPKKKFSYKKKIIIVILIIIFTMTIFILFEKSGYLKKVLNFLETHLQKLYINHKYSTYLIMFFLILIIHILILPCQMIICIFCVIIIKNFLLSFFLITIFTTSSSFIIFFSVKFFCAKFIKTFFRDNEVFKLLEKEQNITSFKTACIIRGLFFSAGIKDYFLIIIKTPFSVFFPTTIIFNSGYCFLYTLVGSEFDKIENFFNTSSLKDKSWIQILTMFIVGLSILITIGFFIFIGFWAKKKLIEKHKVKVDDIVRIKTNNDSTSTEHSNDQIDEIQFSK